MSKPIHSVVVICPAALRDTLIALGQALPDPVFAGLAIRLSAIGTEPVTHYATHTWATSDFVSIMTGATVPEIEGVTPAEIAAVLSQCIVSVDLDGLRNRAHFDAVLAANGLHEVELEEPLA